MKLTLKTLLLSLLTVASVGIHTADAQQQVIKCNTSTGAACNISTNPGDGTQGDPAWLSFGKDNTNFSQIFTMLGNTGTLPVPTFGLQFNNNGTLASLLPGSTGTWCLDWTSLSSAPTLISCAGGGTVTSIGLTVPNWLSSSPATITSSGTFAISGTIEPNNEVLASAASGSQTGLAPRALVALDIPTISASSGLSGTLQAAQEPAHTGDVTNTAGSLAMTVGKVNGLPVPPSSSLVGTNSSSQFVAVTTPLALSLGGTGTASPGLVAGSNISVTGTFPNQTVNANIGSLSFSAQTSGTNSQAAMVVGTGASLSASGSGSISATNTIDVNGAAVPTSALVLGSNSSGQLVFDTTTGTGFPVLQTSPTLVTPTLGVATATSINGTAIPASATLLVNGGALGTPSSATLTNATGLPTTGLTGTLQAAQEPAHTGDMTNSAGSLATSVVKVNGGSLPISAAALATNASGQIVVGSTSGGTVTTSGSPVSGNIAAFSGSTAITNGNLSGDVTTSGTLAATVVKVNGSAVPVSASVLGSNSSGQLVADSTTGTGNAVLATSPTLVTPALGTPSALVLTNATGLPNASVIGLGTFATANVATPPAIGGTTPAAASFSSLTDTGITGSTQCLHVNTAGLLSGTGSDCGAGGGGSSAFSALTSSTNTSAAMVVGTGASLTTAGSGSITATSAATATALAATPSQCSGGQFSTGITANGTANCTTPSGGGNVSNVATPTSGQIAEWTSATTIQGVAVTGTGNVVLSTTPTLVTPALGTPSSATLTNAIGLPISTGVSGLATGVATFLATPTSANLATAMTNETGTGLLVFGTSPTLTTPSLTGSSTGITTLASANAGATNFTLTLPAATDTVTTLAATQTLTNKSIAGSEINSGTVGTGFGGTGAASLSAAAIPVFTGAITTGHCVEWASSTSIEDAGAACGSGSAAFSGLTSGTNTTAAMVVGTGASLAASGSGAITATAAPIAGVTGLGTGVETFLATPTTANFAAAITGETGTGAVVFGTSPSLTSPTIATGETLSFVTGSTQCLQVNTSGVVAGSGGACGGTTLPSIANQTILGNGSGSTATAVALTLGANLVATATGIGFSQAINAQTGTTYALQTTDAGKLITASNAASQAYSLSVATTTGFTAGYSFDIQNLGAGTVTITPTTSTINGASTLVIATNQGCTVTSDGTNYQVSACTALAAGGGSGTVASSTTGQIPVYTAATTVTGSANATLTAGALTLGVSGTAGSVKMGNATSGTVQLQPVTGALGTVTASLPANTGTVAETNLAETFSALQTFGTNISIGGVTATGATGSGNAVFGTSPTLITPALGTPSALTLTNATGLPLTGIATIANNTVLANTSGSTASASATSAANIVGLLNSPTCNAQTGTTYTLVLGDANGCVTMNNAASNVATIPTNASVALPVGSTITVEQLGAGITTITPASGVTFESVQNGTSGTISYALLGPFDYLQFKQISANTWLLTTYGPGRGTAIVNGSSTFTLGTGTGACATTSTLTGGQTAGSFLCTGTAGASTQPIVLPTAPHGWACYASDVTSGTGWSQSVTSTTGCTLKGTIATTSDVVVFSAVGY